MRQIRNLSFLLLVVAFAWSGGTGLRADEGPDCWDSNNGPHVHPAWGNIWCTGDSYDCTQLVFDCCGEDFEGECVIEECFVIGPGPGGCGCTLSTYCDTVIIDG